MRIAALLILASLIVAVPASGLYAGISLSDLEAYWKLDGDMTDSVGTNDGTFTSGVPYYAAGFDGTAGGAINFAGTSSFVSTAFTPATGPKSLSLFFSTTSTGFQALAGSHGGQRFYVGAHAEVDGDATMGLGDGGVGTNPLPSVDFTPTGTDVSTDNAYHHLVLVDDGAGWSRVYYRSPSDAGYLNYHDAYLGTSGGAGSFSIGDLDAAGGIPTSGLVDDVAVFNRMLSRAEIESIWDGGSVEAAIAAGSTGQSWQEGLTPWNGQQPDSSTAKLWLKADAGVVDVAGNPVVPGAAIHQWLDQASGGNDAATHAGTPTLQTISRDGTDMPVVHFAGAEGFEASLGAFTQPQGSVFFVADQQNTHNTQKWLSFMESDATKLSWIGTGNTQAYDALDFGLSVPDEGYFDENNLATAGGLHVYTLTWGEESDEIKARFFIDGQLIHNPARSLEVSDAFTYGDMLFRLGQRAWDESGFFIGDMSEVLVYDENLSLQQINDIGASLTDKYAIESYFLSQDAKLPGDANLDGAVDVSDLGILATNYGQSGGLEWGDGDFTGDGAVDVSDLGILATNYGQTTSMASVPEPASIVGLLCLGLFALAATTRRRA